MLHHSRVFWICFYSFALLLGVSARAQAPPAGIAKPDKAADNSKEAFIIESLRTAVSFENDGTGMRETTARVRVQSDAGVQQWGLLTFGYNSANEQGELGYVRVRKASGTVIETPAADVQDMTSNVTRAAPMYSDYREKHVAVKGLGVGDGLEYQFTTRQRTPLVPGQFWFAYDFDRTVIALDEVLVVSVPRNRDVRVKSPEREPAVTEQGNRRIYTWKRANLERKEDDEAVREVPPPAALLGTFKSWQEVGQWWRELAQEPAVPTPEVRAKAAELTKGAKTYEEKVRALYNYVATKFRYISLSFGIGRYQPHGAAEVLNNEYGDCKDKHTLLASLLAAVGIEAYPALINSSRKLDLDAPSPGQFDHVITAVPERPQSNKLLWLDTTTEVAPFGLLTFNLRDKQALIIPPALPAMLVTTPAEPPFRSYQSYEIDAKLSETGLLEGKVQRVYRGDTEFVMRAVFRQVPQSTWKELVQGISQRLGFAGSVSEVEAGTPEVTAEPFRFSYKYTRKDYPDWANHRITPPLGFFGFPALNEDKKRTQPILLGTPEKITAKARVELPRGYVPKLLPPVDLTRDFAEYHSSYAFKNGVFEAEIQLVTKSREVPLSSLEDYKSFQKAVSDDQNRYTDLSNGSESTSIPSPSANPEVASLIEQAHQAYLQRDLTGAVEALERAVKLDEHDQDAWILLGDLRMAQNHTNEGVAAFRKAIELNPKYSWPYKRLGLAYMVQRRMEEAILVWRGLLKQDPNEKDAHANLGNILLDLKRYDEAVPELEAAVALNKPSARLQLRLAHAYLEAGDKNKAVPAFLKAAEMDLHARTWNDVAYAFADHDLSLSEAQRYAEKAVRSVEDDAAQVNLGKLDVADLERMVELSSYWDTLGWVYFRQGNLDKAGRYLESAWNLQQKSEVGDHLGQVYEKEGKKQKAIDTYAMAISAYPAADLKKQIRARVDRLVGNKATAEATLHYALDDLSHMRRMKLGKLPVKPGSAEFWVLFGPGGKVEDVKFITGDEDLRPFGKTVASLPFKIPLPDDTPTKLVRRGVMVCAGLNLGCDFTVFTVESVHSIN
jgi:tetratricopeptide (TPR) repeat protein/transglutaminase-like putative cysteine protease